MNATTFLYGDFYWYMLSLIQSFCYPPNYEIHLFYCPQIMKFISIRRYLFISSTILRYGTGVIYVRYRDRWDWSATVADR